MNLALMKMAVIGLEKVGRTWEIMGTDVGGQGWVVDPMMALLSGQKRYKSFPKVKFDSLPSHYGH